MRNVRIKVAYDGRSFYGWQRQAGFGTVQETLETALKDLIGEHLTVFGSGRTDTGVHALGQVASFHVDTPLPDHRLLLALNAHLPRSVVVTALESCEEGFHAQASALGKRYLYLVLTTRFRPPFGHDYHHWVSDALDLGAMRRAAGHLVGEHDFSALASAGSARRSSVRHVRQLRIAARRDRLAMLVTGNGFLYNMVRTVAGTLIEVGRGRMSADSIPDILRSGDRSMAGPTAPASGLYLLRVFYGESCFWGQTYGPRGRPGVFV